MKIGLAQLNSTVGDIDGNTDRILDFQRRAEGAGCSLVIYPEMAITGYPPRDLLEKRAFTADNLRALERLAVGCREAALVGFVDRNPAAVGKPVFNAAALIVAGRVQGVYHKSLLPTYDVFDEARYFEPGNERLVFERSGLRFGVTICEDIWRDEALVDRRLYQADPIGRLQDARLDYLINISASPYSLDKETVRRRIACTLSGRAAYGVIYLNQVGGNDELIFDGGSFVVDRQGRLIAIACSFRESLTVFDTDCRSFPGEEEESDPMGELAEALALGLRDYAAKCCFPGALLGLSGGVDSAVCAVLAARALGADNVRGVLMPSPFTSPESTEDAALLASALGIRTDTIPITALYEGFLKALEPVFAGTAPGTAEENIQARIRGNLLMAISNKCGLLLINTGNKSELAMGYCTLYGDLSGGLSLIGDIPKTMVYELGRRLNAGTAVIPERIFTKAPTAELRPNQRDDDSLPPYALLDGILKLYIEENLDPEEIVAAGYEPRLVAEIISRVDQNEYKRRQAPPVLRVTTKSFGIGRRLPIVQRYRKKKQACSPLLPGK